jgi:glucose/mannose transport system substrate-binding protein
MKLYRRYWLPVIFLLLLSFLLVACGGDEEEAAEDTTTTTEEVATEVMEEEEMASEVEVFSWWTGGGEAAGLDAMIVIFDDINPSIDFINSAVAGGAGTNARAVLASRLQASDPPDSWQAHAGQEIIGTYVAAAQIEPLNDLFEAQGWLDVMPDTLIPLISDGGNIYSVPVNIHRANVLWTNPALLDELGVDIPANWDEFFAACETIEAAGQICLSMGEQWTAMHLFEVVLLGELGHAAYNDIWTGGDWGSADVTAALETYAMVLDHVNDDAASLTWQDAAQLVGNGDAAFNIMGDWVDGYFSGDTTGGNLGLVPGEGYGWAPPPGTDGVFQFLSDSFTLAKGAPHPDAATAWLETAGSKDGQEAFNPVKGSICARTDCDTSLFNEYLQTAMADWSSDTVVGSLTHGVTANDTWKDEINTSLGLFLTDGDVSAFQEALVEAAEAHGG